MLRVEKANVCYGDTVVCSQISLEVASGEIVCLLGRNGVGKTTLLKGLMGLAAVPSGSIILHDQHLERIPTHKIARLGMRYVPQGRHIFPDLTVLENLRTATLSLNGKRGEISDEIFGYFPILKERLHQKGGTLSGGQQQMLAIARALAGRPRLVLLDEPSEGIQPNIVDDLKGIIRRITIDTGISFLLVEQNLSFAVDISHRGYVMSKGRIALCGGVDELASDKTIRQYLAV